MTRPARFFLMTSQVNLHAAKPPQKASLPCQAGSPAAFMATMRPRAMMAMRSASRSASSMECVVSTMTLPARFLLTTSQVNLHATDTPQRTFLPWSAW